MTPVHKSPPWVFERQRFLLETLQVKYPRLQPIYKGVLIVVHDEMNPDRIALASHGLRELSEHLMREVGVARSNYNLGSEVHNLRPHWEKVAEDAKVCSGGCSNCTGGGLRKFLKILLKFFERHAENRPKALAKASFAAIELDVNGRIGGTGQNELIGQKWFETNAYFVDIAHHGKTTNLEELEDRMSTFEDILIQLFFSTPSADMQAIDDILAEENANAE